MSSSVPRFIEILLVEDSLFDVRLAMEALEEGHLYCHLNVVDDGIEAMVYLRQEGAYAKAVRPDIILLDLELPRKSGRELLAEIQSDESFSKIPVIIISASTADEELLKMGAKAWITKPVVWKNVAPIISRFL